MTIIFILFISPWAILFPSTIYSNTYCIDLYADATGHEYCYGGPVLNHESDSKPIYYIDLSQEISFNLWPVRLIWDCSPGIVFICRVGTWHWKHYLPLIYIAEWALSQYHVGPAWCVYECTMYILPSSLSTVVIYYSPVSSLFVTTYNVQFRRDNAYSTQLNN